MPARRSPRGNALEQEKAPLAGGAKVPYTFLPIMNLMRSKLFRRAGVSG
jgi:hypothetical protein